jgi:hypothetical protein
MVWTGETIASTPGVKYGGLKKNRNNKRTVERVFRWPDDRTIDDCRKAVSMLTSEFI